MNLHLDQSLSEGYNSSSQKIRIMSESWLGDNMYCPNCGNPRISHLANNSPVADFQCDSCGEIYELKSKHGKLGRKIADGAYATMIERISSDSNPDLFVLQYNDTFDVTRLMLIPRFFFVPAVIEKRKQLPPTARRANWVGCNILIEDIPEQGRITVIRDGIIHDHRDVIQKYSEIKQLQTKSLASRGWLMDVLNCVNAIPNDVFTLREVYAFADQLQAKYVDNQNIKPKIRQQLQFLRDKGFIEFLGRGEYRKKL